MTASCHEQILQAVEALLGALPGITFDPEREAPVPASSLPFLTTYDEGDTPQDDFAGERGATLQLTIEGVAAGATRAAARLAADAVRTAVLSALWADVTLGGRLRDMRLRDEPPRPSLDPEVPEDEVSGFVLPLEFEYATTETDPTTFA